jgi:uncharacterized protein (UPF0261 family)
MGTVAILATLDTKGIEVEYINKIIKADGHQTLLIDTGVLDRPLIKPDCTREEIAQLGGADLEFLLRYKDKGQCLQVMMNGAHEKVSRLYRSSKIDGIISIGGAQGTAIGTYAMRALPVGVPKFMVSTIACGETKFGPYVDNKDIIMMYSVADILGLNFLTKKILSLAAKAISGMVGINQLQKIEKGKAVAMTMIGITTKCAMKIKDILEQHNYEVIVFHGNGVGVKTIDELSAEKALDAVIDLSTNDVTGYLFKGYMSAPPDRFSNVYKSGIPVITVPGGTDIILRGPLELLEDKYKDRPYVKHNPYYTHVRTSPDEMADVGKGIAERLVSCKGTNTILIPKLGFSQLNKKGEVLYDEAGNNSLIQSLKENIGGKTKLKILEAHINDEKFAHFVINEFFMIMDTTLPRGIQ